MQRILEEGGPNSKGGSKAVSILSLEGGENGEEKLVDACFFCPGTPQGIPGWVSGHFGPLPVRPPTRSAPCMFGPLHVRPPTTHSIFTHTLPTCRLQANKKINYTDIYIRARLYTVIYIYRAYYLTHLLYPGLGHNYFAKSVTHVFRQFLGQL